MKQIWLIFLAITLVNGQVSVDPVTQEIIQCEMSNGDVGECVNYYLCDSDTNMTIVDGSYVIDIRAFGPCGIQELCCGVSDIKDETIKPPIVNPITPRPPGPEPTPGGTGNKPGIPTVDPTDLNKCGRRNPNGVLFTITGDKDNEAQFGEFPWIVAILKQGPVINGKTLYMYQCGGSLIHPSVVLTAAHCLVNVSDPSILRVRGGEYDTANTREILKHQDKSVSKIVMHENYHKAALFNDVALLFLNEPMALDHHIGVACLPNPADEVEQKQGCYVSGWGKNEFGRNGSYQNILKRIDLPVVEHKKCQAALRTTRVGRRFVLHKSFMCAGGIPGKDACQGDGGSPLVCPMAGQPNRYEQVGIVAWGIGCNTNIPGVYANVPYQRDWIDDQMIYNGIDLSQYQDNALSK